MTFTYTYKPKHPEVVVNVHLQIAMPPHVVLNGEAEQDFGNKTNDFWEKDLFPRMLERDIAGLEMGVIEKLLKENEGNKQIVDICLDEISKRMSEKLPKK
jgi:hypothetical protein